MNNIIVKDNIITRSGPNISFNEKGLGDQLFSLLKQNGKNVAQYILDTEEVDTYEDFLKRSIRTSLRLRDRNLTNDDIISVCSCSHENTFIPHIAAFFSNIPIACVDINLSVEENGYLLNLVKPKVIFVDKNSVTLIEDALKKFNNKAEIVVFGETETHTPFAEFIKPDEREHDFKPIYPSSLQDTILIVFSSGTSGFPKGICHSHSSVLCLMLRMGFAKTKEMVSICILCYSSPYWVSSIFMLMMAFCAASTRIVANYDVTKLLPTIEKYKVQFLFLSISQAVDLCLLGNPNNIDVSSVKVLTAAGGTLSVSYRKKYQEIFPKAIFANAYVQSESGAITNFDFQISEDIQHALSKPTSCGKPLPGCSYKIVDVDTGELLGVNQKGELRFKSDSVMKGYYEQDSSSCFDSDGYIKTGDILYYDEDYCFYIVDRLKEMIKYRGYFIAPIELEQILLQHPAVKEAVVVGIPHPEDMDHPMGIITLNKNFEHVIKEEILEYFNTKVSDFKKLRGGLKIVSDLPRTPTGKPKRKLIRDLAIQNKL